MKQLLTILGASLCISAFAQKADIDKAIAALDKGNLVEAKMIIDQAIDYQNDYEFYYNKGVTSYESENFEAAVENFEKAYAINPTDGLSMLNAGYASLEIGDNERAEKNFKKASENGVGHLSVFLEPFRNEPLTPIGISNSDSEIALTYVPKGIVGNSQALR